MKTCTFKNFSAGLSSYWKYHFRIPFIIIISSLLFGPPTVIASYSIGVLTHQAYATLFGPALYELMSDSPHTIETLPLWIGDNVQEQETIIFTLTGIFILGILVTLGAALKEICDEGERLNDLNESASDNPGASGDT